MGPIETAHREREHRDEEWCSLDGRRLAVLDFFQGQAFAIWQDGEGQLVSPQEFEALFGRALPPYEICPPANGRPLAPSPVRPHPSRPARKAEPDEQDPVAMAETIIAQFLARR